MSTTRRVLIAVGAPLVLVVGLGLVWGWRNAAVLKAQIESWADSLEHSANPVEMQLSFLPMYVEGEKIGKLSTVVVQRDAPGAVDSLRVVVSLSEDADLDHLAHCRFHLDPDAFDREGPLGFKEAVQCVENVDDLVRFGSIAFAGTDREAGLYLEAHDLPCEHMSHSGEGTCRTFREDIHRLRDEIREEVRGIRMELRQNERATTRVIVH
jgi:hypothetical protein